MPRRQRSNPLALAVLACLTERPMHPYEMAATMRTRGQDQSIRLNYGSLYSVVESLVRRGLLEEHEVARDGRRPERTVYRITDAGHAEVDDWLAELLGTSAKEFPRFEAGLSLMGVLAPDRVVQLLRTRIDALELESLRLESIVAAATRNGIPRVFLVEMDYERALVEADLAFTRTLAADIESGALDGVEQWREFHGGASLGPVRPGPVRPAPSREKEGQP
jgi:DNA-binding PadR family transcriptional regulator